MSNKCKKCGCPIPDGTDKCADCNRKDANLLKTVGKVFLGVVIAACAILTRGKIKPRV